VLARAGAVKLDSVDAVRPVWGDADVGIRLEEAFGIACPNSTRT
jgi:hypothetical protein